MESRKLRVLLEEWLPEATIDEMQEKMENGDLTAKELVLPELPIVNQSCLKLPIVSNKRQKYAGPQIYKT